MKTTKTFENATLRTVNHGYIELDYNGKTHCFHDASVISVNNGSISIEVDWEPKEGELVKITGACIDAYCIIDWFGTRRSSVRIWPSRQLKTFNTMNKKYILTEWPESQEVMGHPDCYLVSSCKDEATLDGACMVPEELFLELKTNNRSLCDITSMHSQYQFLENLLRESIRHYLSRLLMETDENKPLECKICLSNPEGFGLSSLNFPWIYQIWQHPVEGIIYFSYSPDGSEAVEFDNMVLEDLITICKELDEN